MEGAIEQEPIRLTRYSHGAGCGCKIAPAVLETILKSAVPEFKDPRLLVGYGHRDDAAVYDLGNGRALISTTDFFSPIVDDPFDFGRIAATNALSDVYAMGGSPLMAVAILGWPVEKLPPELAQRVLDGARTVCHEANIPLAGGHSIDAPEPFFGLAVTGEVATGMIKRNDSATAGDVLILTKPLGVGILSTAEKRGVIRAEDVGVASAVMCRSNAIGKALGQMEAVTAMTDVTGFGLGGHLLEMCRGSGLSAKVQFDRIPVIPQTEHYIQAGCYPDGAFRNWKSYGEQISGAGSMSRMLLMSDPQTSGGLLIALGSQAVAAVQEILIAEGLEHAVLGSLQQPDDGFVITVE